MSGPPWKVKCKPRAIYEAHYMDTERRLYKDEDTTPVEKRKMKTALINIMILLWSRFSPGLDMDERTREG